MPWFWFKKAKKPELTNGQIIKTVTVEVTHEYKPRGIDKATQTEEHLLDPAPQVYRPLRSASLDPLVPRNKGPSPDEQGFSRSNTVKIPSGASAEVQEQLERLSTFEGKARRAISRVGNLLEPTISKVSKRPSIPSVIVETEEVKSSIP